MWMLHTIMALCTRKIKNRNAQKNASSSFMLLVTPKDDTTEDYNNLFPPFQIIKVYKVNHVFTFILHKTPSESS